MVTYILYIVFIYVIPVYFSTFSPPDPFGIGFTSILQLLDNSLSFHVLLKIPYFLLHTFLLIHQYFISHTILSACIIFLQFPYHPPHLLFSDSFLFLFIALFFFLFPLLLFFSSIRQLLKHSFHSLSIIFLFISFFYPLFLFTYLSFY